METDTQALEKLSDMIASKIKDSHLRCNKEVEIAIIQKQLEGFPRMQEDVKEIKEAIIVMKTDKNWAIAIVGFIASLVGLIAGEFIKK